MKVFKIIIVPELENHSTLSFIQMHLIFSGVSIQNFKVNNSNSLGILNFTSASP